MTTPPTDAAGAMPERIFAAKHSFSKVCGNWSLFRKYQGRGRKTNDRVEYIRADRAQPPVKNANKVALAIAREWVTCPICHEPDMPFFSELNAEDGSGYIHCNNTSCPSNSRILAEDRA